jgi:hypothetical protein
MVAVIGFSLFGPHGQRLLQTERIMASDVTNKTKEIKIVDVHHLMPGMMNLAFCLSVRFFEKEEQHAVERVDPTADGTYGDG